MSISAPYIPVPKELYFHILQSKLSPTQKTVYLYVAGKVYEWPETREENAIKLSVRYIGNAIGKQFQHVASALKNLARQGYLAVTKGVTPHEASTIKLLPAPVTNNVTPADKKNTIKNLEFTGRTAEKSSITESVTLQSQNSLQNQESILKNNHQESNRLEGIDLFITNKEEKIRQSEINIKVNSSNCNLKDKDNLQSSKYNNINKPVLNLLRPATGPSGQQFSAPGSVLTNIPAPLAESKTSLTGDSAISDNILVTGKEILKNKNYSETEAQSIVDRILGIMKKQKVNSPNKYFTYACENEKPKAATACFNSGVPSVEKTREYVQKFWKEEVKAPSTEEILQKLSKVCPDKLYTVIQEVNNNTKIQKGLSFMPAEGEARKLALENIILSEFKKNYPQIVV